MDTEHTRKARQATDGAVLTALRHAGDLGMLPGELADAVPSLASATLTKSLRRLATSGHVRRESERGRVYALPVRPDGSPMSAEDIAAEAAARRAEFLARRDAAIVTVEAAARIDLRTVHPRLKPIATARTTYLRQFAQALRQCTTQERYDAIDRAFDMSAIESEWNRIKTELEQERERQTALAEQQKQWDRQRSLEAKLSKALPAGSANSPHIQRRQPGRPSRKTPRMRIRDDWAPAANQILLPQPAPDNTPPCEHCLNPFGQDVSPVMYWCVSPAFPSGRGLCDRHAEAERYGPHTNIYLITWK